MVILLIYPEIFLKHFKTKTKIKTTEYIVSLQLFECKGKKKLFFVEILIIGFFSFQQ